MKNVIKAKYGIDELGWWSKNSSYSHGVDCWKSTMAVSVSNLWCILR